MNIVKAGVSKTELNSRVLRLQVRVKGILNALIEQSEESIIPEPLLKFLNKLTRNKTYLPDNYLTPFEESRLKFTDDGGLAEMNRDREALLISFFVISRTLVKNMLLKPTEVLNRHATDQAKKLVYM